MDKNLKHKLTKIRLNYTHEYATLAITILLIYTRLNYNIHV